MMTKFYVGQKVRVTGNSYYSGSSYGSNRASCLIGKICLIKSCIPDSGVVSVWTPDENDWWIVKKTDLQPITETPKEITVNGVTYVRKPEPEHVWKFGDIAHERKTGDVVFVISWEPVSETVVVARKAYGDPDYPVLIPAKSLTFLRRADLSV